MDQFLRFLEFGHIGYRTHSRSGKLEVGGVRRWLVQTFAGAGHSGTPPTEPLPEDRMALAPARFLLTGEFRCVNRLCKNCCLNIKKLACSEQGTWDLPLTGRNWVIVREWAGSLHIPKNKQAWCPIFKDALPVEEPWPRAR